MKRKYMRFKSKSVFKSANNENACKYNNGYFSFGDTSWHKYWSVFVIWMSGKIERRLCQLMSLKESTYYNTEGPSRYRIFKKLIFFHKLIH